MPLTNVKLNLNVYTSKRDDILQQFFNLAKSYFSKNPNLTTQQKINWFNEYQKRWFGINLANTDLGRIRDNISYSKDVEDYLKLFNLDEFNNYVVNWGRNNGLFTNTGGHSGDDYLHNVDGLHGAITWMRRPGQYTTDSSELDYYNQRYADFFKENNMEGAESFFDENGLQLWRDKNSPTTSPSRFNFGNYSFKPDYKFNFGTLSSPFGSTSPGGLTQPSSTVNPKLEELKIRYPFLGKILFPEHSFKPDYTLGGQYPWMSLVGGGKVEDKDPDKEPRWYEKFFAKLNDPIVKNDLMGLGRVIMDNAANNRYTNQLLNSLSTGLKQPGYIGRRIYGDYAGLRLMYNLAARLENKANQAFSSDANLTQATRLEAYDKAQQYRQKGDLIDNERIAKTDEAAWILEAKNVENSVAAANYNNAALAELGNKKAEIRHQNSVANMQNWDKFLAGILKRYKLRAEELEAAQKMVDDLQWKLDLPNYSSRLYALYDKLTSLDKKSATYSLDRQALQDEIDKIEQELIRLLFEYYKNRYGVTPRIKGSYKIRTVKSQRGGKILKMANGGLSFVTYTTIDDEAKASSRASSATSKKKDSSGDEFTLKDFVKDIGNALKGMDLLDVDAESILERASIDLMVGQAIGGTTPERLTLSYLQILGMLNKGRRHAKEYDKAYHQAKSQDALGEIAVNGQGLVAVKDRATTQVTLIDPETYMNNRQRYLALTNRDVLLERDKNPDLKFDPSWSSIVDVGIGSKKIAELLNTLIGDLGKSDLSKDTIKGAQLLLGLSSGQILVENITTADQKRQVVSALNVLGTMLPQNVRSLLYIKGGGTQKGVQELLYSYVVKGTSDTYKYTIKDFDDINLFLGKGKSRSSDKEKDPEKMTTYQDLISGRLGSEGTFVLNPGGIGEMTVRGLMLGSIPTNDNKVIPGTTLMNMLQSGPAAIVNNRDNITLGNHKLNAAMQETSVYDGNGGMRVILPINADGTVNLEVAEKYTKLVEQAISKVGPINSEADKAKYQKVLGELMKNDPDLQQYIKADGTPDYEGHFSTFLAVTGYTVTDDKGFGDDETYIEDVSEDEASIQLVERLLTTDPKHPVELDLCDTWIFEGSCQKVYKGTIYIPLSINPNDARHALEKETAESELNANLYQAELKNIEKIRSAQRLDPDKVLHN